MLKNYILIAWRSLSKNKLFSFINIFGLALSMSVCMIVLIRITDAFEYDNFHSDEDNLYRVVSEITNRQGNSWKLASTPLPLKEALRSDSLMATVTHIYPSINTIAKDASREFAVNGTFIEPSFFDVFGFTLKSGNKSSLSNPYQLILSETTAKKIFGETDPTGKSINMENLGEFVIAGVMNPAPSKSHINYDVFVSFVTVPLLERSTLLPKKFDTWDSFEQGYTYIRVNGKTDSEIIISKLTSVASEINRVSIETVKPEQRATFAFELQPLSSITPGAADIYNDIGRGPSMGSLLAESGIVLIILLAACFNYTNLSLARALTRSKEVGIRKLSGAQRWQIFAQYITESILIAVFALILANLILAPILEFKPFNDGYEMVPSVAINIKLMGVFILFAIFAGLLAGSLPAWILSAFQPARILRGIGSEKLVGNISFRKVLLVFQFSLSLIILVFLSTFYQQFDFMATSDLGYNRENIVLVPAGTNSGTTVAAFNQMPQVTLTGTTSASFGSASQITASRTSRDKDAAMLEQYYCDDAWIKMSNLKTVAGSTETEDLSSVTINSRAVTILGFENPSVAIGSIIYIKDSIPVRIGAVIADFYSRGFGNPVQPMILQKAYDAPKYIAIHSKQHTSDFISNLEHEWKKQNPDHAFDYISLDEKAKAENDQSAEISLLGFLGFMTVTIALLGLLGLVVYTVEIKRKEISIRKIIGASVHQIVSLLSGSFVKLLALSGLIALPIAYFLSKIFLMNFVNQVGIGMIDLFLCFLILLVAGLFTILSQTWKASLENPSRNLRSE